MRCIQGQSEQTEAVLEFVRASTGRIGLSSDPEGDAVVLTATANDASGGSLTRTAPIDWLAWIHSVQAASPETYALKILFEPESQYILQSFVPPEFDELHLDPPSGWQVPVPPALALLVRSTDGIDVSFRRQRIESIDHALAIHRQVVLLGDAGAGKTTVLQLSALDAALNFLRDSANVLPLLARISNQSPSAGAHQFLLEQWQSLYADPHGGEFDALLEDSRLMLLLDGLNEVGRKDTHTIAKQWMAFFKARPTCRAIVTCRKRDYDAPLKMQQVEIVEFDSKRQRVLAERLLGQRSPEFLRSINHFADASLLSNPFSLTMLAWLFASGDHTSNMPYARLLSGYVQAFVTRAFHRLEPTRQREGQTFIQHLAWMMQSSTVTIAVHAPASIADNGPLTIDISGGPPIMIEGELVAAAASAGLLLEDGSIIRFRHQLIQEVLSARFLAARWDARAFDVEHLRPSPTASEPADPLAVWERLPPATQTGWEAVVALAADLVTRPDEFLLDVLDVNLLLGSYAICRASEAGDRSRRTAGEKLAQAIESPATTLRERVLAADLIAAIGDPRLTRPSAVRATGLIDVPFVSLQRDRTKYPRMSRYQVTVDQFAGFVDDNGYTQLRWWSDAGRAWLSDGLAGRGAVDGMMSQRNHLQASGLSIDHWASHYGWRTETKEFWERLLAADEPSALAELRARFLRREPRAPAFWTDPDYHTSSMPVVGVTYFEADAFAKWLTVQIGVSCEVPSADDWWHASAGPGGSEAPYPWGDEDDPSFANAVESHVLRLMPVGTFTQDRGASGSYDFVGNARDWTSTPFVDQQQSLHPRLQQLIVCGGAWSRSLKVSTRHFTDHFAPDFWDYNLSFRIVQRASEEGI